MGSPKPFVSCRAKRQTCAYDRFNTPVTLAESKHVLMIPALSMPPLSRTGAHFSNSVLEERTVLSATSTAHNVIDARAGTSSRHHTAEHVDIDEPRALVFAVVAVARVGIGLRIPVARDEATPQLRRARFIARLIGNAGIQNYSEYLQ